MKRIEIEIDDETDALLDALMASREASKPTIIRRLIEDGVRDMVRAGSATDPGAGNGNGRNEPGLQRLGDLSRLRDEEARRGYGLAPADSLDAIVGSIDDDPVDWRPPDPLDALVGKYEGESGDVDEIVYGR